MRPLLRTPLLEARSHGAHFHVWEFNHLAERLPLPPLSAFRALRALPWAPSAPQLQRARKLLMELAHLQDSNFPSRGEAEVRNELGPAGRGQLASRVGAPCRTRTCDLLVRSPRLLRNREKNKSQEKKRALRASDQ